jgi:outer membrane protein assembly factor BamB
MGILLLILTSCGNAAPTTTGSQATTVVSPTQKSTATKTGSTDTQASTNWTTYHGNNLRTGYLSNMPDPGHLTQAWSTMLDGAVYAEPLVVGGHVLVATENDSLYSLDANTGHVLWHTNFGQPVPLSSLPCGNIDPLGITGTPVYDPASNLVFAVAEVSGPAHILVGVNASTGAVVVRRSADPAGMSIPAHQQRGALALSQGKVYITYGGLYGDCGNYHGWVVASATNGQGALTVFKTPTTREGGIWAPPGPTIDSAGNVYVSVGNGEATGGNWDHSDSILRLSPTLQLQDGFAPQQWAQDNASDLDLGSMSPILLPNGLIFAAGKSGQAYVMRANALGGVGGQLHAQSICSSYGGSAALGTQIFIPCTDGVQQITVGSNGALTVGWKASSQIQGSPVIGGNTVYSVDPSGMLYALNRATGAVRTSISIGATSRFATPTLTSGRVFIGTTSGVVAVTVA